MGYKPLSGIQLGIESVVGTLAPATSILAGEYVARHRPLVNTVRPQELRTLMAKNYRSVIVGRGSQLHVEGTTLYEDLCYFLGMGLKGAVTGGAGDGGTPPMYVRTYAPALTAGDQPDTYTFEMGDDTQFWAYPGVFATSLQLAIVKDQLTVLTSDLVGRPRTAQAKTGALTQRTNTEDAVSNNWTLAIDATGGTIGTTSYAGCLLNATWRAGQFVPFKCIDGTLVYTSIAEQALGATLETTVVVDASYVALLTAAFENQTRQLVRLENIGTVVHGAVHKRIRIDGAYVLIDAGEIGGSDDLGKQTVRLMWESEYDPTAALLYKAEVQNALAALP